MKITLMPTVHSTHRIDVWDMNLLEFDVSLKIKNYLSSKCCWGGPDKQEVKDHETVMLSWEIPSPQKENVFEGLQALLDNQGIDFNTVFY